jgi:hypothetical protein
VPSTQSSRTSLRSNACGTESNGGFKNITIGNCVFESCRGFALESVDGGPIEDITFTGVTMRDIRNAPFFLRLGARLRAPAGTGVGKFKRVIISNINCNAPANDMPAIIAGVPGSPIEDDDVCHRSRSAALLYHQYIRSRSGSTLSQASLVRCQRRDCSCVMPRTLHSVMSKSQAFKPTRDRSCGSATSTARTFPVSACRLVTVYRHCVCTRPASYEYREA